MLANRKIFKAYDIRGEWNKDWDSEFVYKIGQAIASSLKPKTIAIGKDMRESSKEIFTQLSEALLEQGVDVIDIGLCGTELTYFASSFVPEVDATIMITASHNPGKDNGMKITMKGSIAIGLSNGLDQIRDLALSNLQSEAVEKKGTLTKRDLWPEYRNHVFSMAKMTPDSLKVKRIVVDAGNGVGGYMFDKVLSLLPIETVRLFWDPDGTFPNHLADPFRESNVETLKKKVIEEEADLGIAYDGDGDRVFFVDETGRYLPGYYLSALLTEIVLSKNVNTKEETIAHDPRYYWATKDSILKHGAKPIKSKVGHTLIKAAMREHNSLFATECSGHVFYRENNNAESSMFTTLLILKLISEQGPLSSKIANYFHEYPISGEINFIVDNPQDILKKIETRYSNGKIDYTDGVGIEFPEWSCSVRSSNTQPLLRLNIEGKSKGIVDEKVEELKGIIGGEIAED